VEIVPEGDDDELRVLRPVLDVVRDDRNVPEIQRGIDFVHKVQRSRLDTKDFSPRSFGQSSGSPHLVGVKSEHQRKRAQSLLSTGQIGDIPPTLFRWHHAEDDTFREGIHTIHQLKFGVSS
jgi:hypothetical protein